MNFGLRPARRRAAPLYPALVSKNRLNLLSFATGRLRIRPNEWVRHDDRGANDRPCHGQSCLPVVVSGGRGISREPGGRSSAEEVTVLAGYERVAMSDALFAHLHLPTQYGEKNVPSDNELRENERNQRRRRPISRCSCEVIFTSYFPEGALKRHHRRRRRERPRYLLITGRQESAPLLGGERARMQVG